MDAAYFFFRAHGNIREVFCVGNDMDDEEKVQRTCVVLTALSMSWSRVRYYDRGR